MKIHILIIFIPFLTLSCSNSNQNNELISQLRAELDSLSNLTSEDPIDSKDQIATFLTFQKENAEEAMNYYVELFDNSEIIDLQTWGKEAPGKEGTVMHATFILDGNLFMCSDSPPIHEWGFTPAVSNFVECNDVIELERLFTKLSENGKVMMPLDNYGFSQKFGFIEDKFGVSWQLNLQ